MAFPNISTGVYAYPKRDAAEAAVETVTNWANDRPVLDQIVFVCFDSENYLVYQELLGLSA